jgi:hypothetical protein
MVRGIWQVRYLHDAGISIICKPWSHPQPVQLASLAHGVYIVCLRPEVVAIVGGWQTGCLSNEQHWWCHWQFSGAFMLQYCICKSFMLVVQNKLRKFCSPNFHKEDNLLGNCELMRVKKDKNIWASPELPGLPVSRSALNDRTSLWIAYLV